MYSQYDDEMVEEGRQAEEDEKNRWFEEIELEREKRVRQEAEAQAEYEAEMIAQEAEVVV